MRLKSTQKRRHVLEGPVRDDLARDSAVRVDTEEQHTAAAIQETAQSLAGSRELARAGFEFNCLGFALRGDPLDVHEYHR